MARGLIARLVRWIRLRGLGEPPTNLELALAEIGFGYRESKVFHMGRTKIWSSARHRFADMWSDGERSFHLGRAEWTVGSAPGVNGSPLGIWENLADLVPSLPRADDAIESDRWKLALLDAMRVLDDRMREKGIHS